MIESSYENTYVPKIQTLLQEIRQEALERGFVCSEPSDLTDECVRWFVVVQPKGTEPDEEVGVDVTIQIAESEAYEGTDEGINFMLDVVCLSGRILGGLCPCNYTPQCWVPKDDADAIEARWSIFFGGWDASVVLDSVEEYFAKS